VNKNLSKRISVIVATSNNNGVVFPAFESLFTQLTFLGCDFEIIIGSDKSDNDIEKTQELERLNGQTDKIKTYYLPRNLNSSFVLYHGFKKTSGDPVCFLDLNQDVPPKNLRIALAYFDEYQADIVVGSKRHPKSNFDPTPSFLLSSYLSQGILKFLFNLNLRDPQITLGVFRRQLLQDLIPRLKVGSLLELLILANLMGYKKIFEAPLISNYQFSKIPHFGLTKKILAETITIFGQKVFTKTYLKPVSQPNLIKL